MSSDDTDMQISVPCASSAVARSARQEALEEAARYAKSYATGRPRDTALVIAAGIRSLASSIEATGGGSDTSTCKPQSHARQETVAQSRPLNVNEWVTARLADAANRRALMFGKITNRELAAFLFEAADYFRKRHTGGEDGGFWANEANAKRCEIAAGRLAAPNEPHTLAAHGNEVSEPEAVKPNPSNDGVTAASPRYWLVPLDLNADEVAAIAGAWGQLSPQDALDKWRMAVSLLARKPDGDWDPGSWNANAAEAQRRANDGVTELPSEEEIAHILYDNLVTELGILDRTLVEPLRWLRPAARALLNSIRRS